MSGLFAVALVEAKVCTVIYLNELAVLIKNDCCTITVGCESAGVVLVENDHGVACCGCCSYFLVVDPLAFGSSEFLAVNGNNLIKGCKSETGKSDSLAASTLVAVYCTERKCPTARCVGCAVVGKNDKKLAFAEFGPCYGCISSGGEVSGCCLAFCSPEAAVCTVIDLDELAVCVNNNCCAVTVGCKAAGVVLIKDPHSLGCCICSSDFGVVCPLAVNCLKGLAVNGDELGVFVTCALSFASRVCASCIGALAAVFTNVFAIMLGLAYALVGTSCLGAFCVLALTASFANVLASMSGSLRESNAGDGHLSTDCTVAEEEGTGKVACSAVRRYDEVFAFLTRCECLLEVVSCSALSCVYNACLVICIIVLAVCTVVDANDLAVLIENECFTPTVAPVESAFVCGSVKNKEVRTENGEVLVNCDLVGEEIVGLVADGNLYKVINNFNYASNGSGESAVGCGEGNGVGTCNVNVKAAVVSNGNFNCGIVGRIEGTVIIENGETTDNCCQKIEISIGQVSENLVVVTGDYGSLVYVGSENFLVICPKEANNVTVLVNYVVVHKATTVGVNGGAAVTVLNNDCIAACRNGEVLCKCACNGNGFAVDLNRGCGACGSVGVCLVNELGVSTVTAFEYKAVSIDDCCYAVAAGNANSDCSVACVVEYAADCCFCSVVTVKGYEFLVFEGKEVTLPLVFAKSVRSYLESEGGESLENGNCTGCGSSLAVCGNCGVGNGVGAFNLCIEAVIVFDKESSFTVNGYAKHEVDFVACMNFERLRNYADRKCTFFGSGFFGCRGSCLARCRGSCFIACAGGEELARCKGKYKYHYKCDYCQKL